jgi:hypothetical protein
MREWRPYLGIGSLALIDEDQVSQFKNSVRVCRVDGREMTFDGGGLRAGSTWAVAAGVRRGQAPRNAIEF